MKKKQTKKATAGERIQMRALAKTLPGHCKGLDDFRTRALFSVCRESARAIDRECRRKALTERWRCLEIIEGKMNNLNTSHASRADLDAVWGLIDRQPIP